MATTYARQSPEYSQTSRPSLGFHARIKRAVNPYNNGPKADAKEDIPPNPAVIEPTPAMKVLWSTVYQLPYIKKVLPVECPTSYICKMYLEFHQGVSLMTKYNFISDIPQELIAETGRLRDSYFAVHFDFGNLFDFGISTLSSEEVSRTYYRFSQGGYLPSVRIRTFRQFVNVTRAVYPQDGPFHLLPSQLSLSLCDADGEYINGPHVSGQDLNKVPYIPFYNSFYPLNKKLLRRGSEGAAKVISPNFSYPSYNQKDTKEDYKVGIFAPDGKTFYGRELFT